MPKNSYKRLPDQDPTKAVATTSKSEQKTVALAEPCSAATATVGQGNGSATEGTSAPPNSPVNAITKSDAEPSSTEAAEAAEAAAVASSTGPASESVALSKGWTRQITELFAANGLFWACVGYAAAVVLTIREIARSKGDRFFFSMAVLMVICLFIMCQVLAYRRGKMCNSSQKEEKKACGHPTNVTQPEADEGGPDP
eukprot:m.22718 g.22718  ORF g.22718 m.22718 type:complete len:198 (-) comp11288_c0_seq2:131-724(-)